MCTHRLGSGILVVLLLALLGSAAPEPTSADVWTWQGPNPNDLWSHSANWLPNGAPAPGDEVVINNGTSARIADIDVTISFLRAGDGGNGGVILDSGTLTVTGYGAYAGRTASDVGTYVVNGGTLTGNVIVGQSRGANLFTQNDGLVKAKQLLIGNGTYGNGRYQMQGGRLEVGTTGFRIAAHTYGVNQTGVLTQTGGDIISDSPLWLGHSIADYGSSTYNLFGGTLTLKNATPFEFLNTADDRVHFNLIYGTAEHAALNLPGTWDFARLMAGSGADVFRLYGQPIDASQLVFLPGTGDLLGYTTIFAVPEPSTLLLAALAIGGVGLIVYRRRAVRD